MTSENISVESAKISIQPAAENDYAQWLPLWRHYQEFYRADIPDDITQLIWARFLAPEEPIYCAVAKCEENIVGLVHYLFHRSTWGETYYCYLEDLYVNPDVRGRQIGKQLIEYVQQQAQKRHASRLYWHTHETNLRGQRLYDWVAKKSGMIEYRMPLR